MSHKPHDQNQGLETPDTAPSRGRVIALSIIMYAIVACAGYFFIVQVGNSVNSPDERVGTPTISGSGAAHPAAAYLISPTSALLTPEQIAVANMTTASNVVELATVLGNSPEIQVIYIDPNAVGQLDVGFLRQQLANGKTIVGLKVDHDSFVEQLGFGPTIANIDPIQQSQVLIWASFIKQEGEGVTQEVGTFEQFVNLLATAEQFGD